MISRHSSSVIWSSGFSRRSAALLTRTSMRPKRSAAVADHARRPRPHRRRRRARASALAAGRPRSRAPPRPPPRDCVRALTTTAAPPAASSSAIARPILRPAPVTMATRPASSWFSQSLITRSAQQDRSVRHTGVAHSAQRGLDARARPSRRGAQLRANFSSMSCRVSGSCAPPRICGWRSSTTSAVAQHARGCGRCSSLG